MRTGVDISDIVPKEDIELEILKGNIVALDAYNILYQFVSTIRQPDGTPLKDGLGRVTSHLSGLFYRTAKILELNIKPIFVFDGKPHPLKRATIDERVARKEKAKAEYEEALAAGDIEKARSKATQTSRLTKEMVAEAKRLLDLMGVPHLTAPGEGEAQASFMVTEGVANAVGSQDFDSLLFGADVLVRNMTFSGRRKLPRRNIYITVVPERIELERSLGQLQVTREQLVDMGILVGTDFNPGVKGIGPKKALKYMREFGSLERVMEEKASEQWGMVEGYKEIRRIFLEPDVTDDFSVEWGTMVKDEIKAYLCNERDFSEARVEGSLKKLDMVRDTKAQTSLDLFG
jgi:flap endonuclease-1